MSKLRVLLKLLQFLLVLYQFNQIDAAYLPVRNPVDTPVLMILFHGLRADRFEEFVQKHPDSAFKKMIDEGVKAEFMRPSFPSLTYPNQYTLVTGLNVENHGIVHNSFFDPAYDQSVQLSTHDASSIQAKWWNQSEPLWLTLRKNGRKTASYHWAGSDVTGRQPHIWDRYDENYPEELKIDDAIEWLNLFKVEFSTLHFIAPGKVGIQFGPKSSQYADEIKRVDGLVGNLVEKLKSRQLYDKVNIVIVGDHGLADMGKSSTVVLSDYADEKVIDLIDLDKSVFGPVTHIYPKEEDKTEEVYNSLKKTPHTITYYKKDIPSSNQFSYYYKNNDRIAPILVVCDEGYTLDLKNQTFLGSGGFSNLKDSMNTVFLARGPSFKTGVSINQFRNVHVYSLLCYLTNVECKKTDGTIDPFVDGLKDYVPTTTTTTTTIATKPTTTQPIGTGSTTTIGGEQTTTGEPTTEDPEATEPTTEIDENSTSTSTSTTTTKDGRDSVEFHKPIILNIFIFLIISIISQKLFM